MSLTAKWQRHFKDILTSQVKVPVADDDAFVGLKCFISKLDPSCTVFFQCLKQLKCEPCRLRLVRKPTARCSQVRQMLKTISGGSTLSQIHQPFRPGVCHNCAFGRERFWSQIIFVSGHSSEQSIAYYNSRPSASHPERVPDTISHALEREQPHSTQIPLIHSFTAQVEGLLMWLKM